MTLDGLSLYYEVSEELYVATRATTSEMFASPQPLAQLSSAALDNSPSLSPDDLTLYFSSTRNGSPQLFRATRATPTDPFGAPTLVPELASVGVIDAYETRDEVFYTENLSTIVTIWRATSNFTVVTKVSELSGPAGIDGWPTLTPDLTTIYFESFRNGMTSIYMARRGAPGLPFGPVELSPFGFAGAQNADPEMSRDGRTFLFSSDHSGNPDLYMMTRECL